MTDRERVEGGVEVIASAPAKLVLVGEYAVLHGAPALVMAVNRRAVATIQPSDDETCRVRAPAIGASEVRFVIRPTGGIAWIDIDLDTRKRFRLVEDTLVSLGAQGGVDFSKLASFQADLDTEAFFLHDPAGRRVKLGLGSSGALTVAFASALAEFAGGPSRPQPGPAWLAQLLQAHWLFQQGSGSGLDVAASCYGGLIGYRRGEIPDRPEVVRLRRPEDLEILVVWSGRAASTTEFLRRIEAYQRRDPRGHEARMDRLGEIADSAIRYLRAADTGSFVGSVADYGEALRALGDAAGVAIFSPEHQHIQELAHRAGAVYKPSGAGGGDVGVAVAASKRVLAELGQGLASEGFPTLALQEDPQGLHIECVTRE